MTSSPPRSLAELTVWAASHPGGAADEIKRLTDALEKLRDSIWRRRDTWLAQEQDWLRSEHFAEASNCSARAYEMGLVLDLLASFSDRPDERNQT